MKLPSADFESAASAIPPHPVKLDYFSIKKTDLQAFSQKFDQEKSDAKIASLFKAYLIISEALIFVLSSAKASFKAFLLLCFKVGTISLTINGLGVIS